MDEAKLLDGALAVITASGLRNLTLASVAAESGVSRASVYRTFTNRAGLVDAVVRRELGALDDVLTARLRFSDDPRVTVVMIVREVLHYFDENPALRSVLRHDGADMLPYLIDDGAGSPTLVDLVTAQALSRIADTELADSLRPDPPRAVEHMVRVVFAHFLIPSRLIDDATVAESVAAAVVGPR